MRAILHNIRSLHNVGSIFRTADAAGVERLYLTGYTPAPEDEYGLPRGPLVKTALGAEKTVPWEKRKDLSKLIAELKKQGHKIYAVEQDKRSVSCASLRLSRRELDKAVLAVGNEVRGLSPALLRRADKIVEIPMFGKKESLNVSVAFGVAAYFLIANARDKKRRKR